MKCKDCAYCNKGWFPNMPDAYVCTAIKNPIVISNISRDCSKCGDKPDDMKMDETYRKLLQNLNAVKWDLQEMDNPRLSLCIKRIKDAILDAGRLNSELVKLRAIQELR